MSRMEPVLLPPQEELVRVYAEVMEAKRRRAEKNRSEECKERNREKAKRFYARHREEVLEKRQIGRAHV